MVSLPKLKFANAVAIFFFFFFHAQFHTVYRSTIESDCILV